VSKSCPKPIDSNSKRIGAKLSEVPAKHPIRMESRIHLHVSLSNSCIAAIDRRSEAPHCSRSAAIARLFVIDYAGVFQRFKNGESFVDIVIETGGGGTRPYRGASSRGRARHLASRAACEQVSCVVKSTPCQRQGFDRFDATI